VPNDFQVVFEAIMRDISIIEDDNKGDIAIDDIVVVTNVGCCKYFYVVNKDFKHLKKKKKKTVLL